MSQSGFKTEYLTITDQANQLSFFGGDQIWYSRKWSKDAGCGPTCAANILAYLSFAHPALKPLYHYPNLNINYFTDFMELLFEFVTPGRLGVNKPEMFSDGVLAYAESKNIALQAEVISIPAHKQQRPSFEKLLAYIQAGMSVDCPIAFLNLSRGKVRAFQGWHWITITRVVAYDNERIIVEASDEGRILQFDLMQWLTSSALGGGFVYFKPAE